MHRTRNYSVYILYKNVQLGTYAFKQEVVVCIFTSYGLRLKYVEPGLRSLSICCGPVNTESFFSIAFTLIHNKHTMCTKMLEYSTTKAHYNTRDRFLAHLGQKLGKQFVGFWIAFLFTIFARFCTGIRHLCAPIYLLLL